MCGICGYISKNRITNDQLRTMNDTIIHRGPDDSGVECYDAENGYVVGFAQRRLSILDLSPLGHQPMHSKSEAGTSTPRVSVVYNGEIYNFLELKDELADYEFKSNCDTEVIIASYLKWGKDCFNKFNGMFAIAIYDHSRDKLVIARDRMGKKPLYYQLEDDNLYFASELKPLMVRPGFNKEIRKDVMARYLYQQYASY